MNYSERKRKEILSDGSKHKLLNSLYAFLVMLIWVLNFNTIKAIDNMSCN